MTPKSATGRAWVSGVAVLAVLALVAAGVVYVLNRTTGTKYSAMLSTVVGLYPGADVRVLGVPVGTIDSVTPQGQLVKVDFHVKSDIKVPAEAMAAVVSPTVVADRYLQLAPPYTGGPTMPADTVIPKERTASPAEFDDLLASAQKLSTALGPQGVNSSGALSEALSTLARNLNGNGAAINTTLDNTSQAVTTLSANRENLAGTVRNLQSFTTNLKQSDGQVRAFTKQFAEVSGYLADERKNLGETLRELSITLGELAKFVHDNRDQIRVNVDRLSEVLGTVAGEKRALEQVLDAAPTGLDGLVNAYNGPPFGTLDTRPALLPSVLCSFYGIFQQLLGQVPGGNVLLGVITTIFNTTLPGGLAGCVPHAAATGTPSKPLPANAGSGLAAPLTALPQLPGAQQPAAGQPRPAATERDGGADGGSSDDTPAGQQREKPPSLGDLFGGGL